MSDFFRKFIDDVADETTTVAGDGLSASEFTGFIDSGSYVLNAALSGSLFQGLPNNKAIVFAGDPATGKTFFALGLVKSFLDSDPKAAVIYFDTESAVTNAMLAQRGIDVRRVAKSEPESIERFRSVATRMLDEYAKMPENERFPLMIVLDSLSMLPSQKELTDVAENKDTRDMTKPGLIKGAFRVLRLKLAKVKVPLIVTNHVYAVIGSYVPTKDMAGGCLVAGTPVVLATGETRCIEDVVPGDEVKTLYGPCVVDDTHHFVRDVYRVVLDDGRSVECSGEHKFLVKGRGWVCASELTTDDAVEVVQNINSDTEAFNVSLSLPDHE